MIIRPIVLTAGALALGTTATAGAAPIPIANAGFEADFALDGTFPVGPVADWLAFDPDTVLGGFANNFTGVINPTGSDCFNQADAPEGRNAALIFLDNPASIGLGPVGLRQQLGAQLQPNTTYTLIVEVGNIASCAGLPPFDTLGVFDLDGFPGYAVQVLAGGQVVAEDFNTLADEIPEGEFRTSIVGLVVRDTHPHLNGELEIRLINLNLEDTPEAPGVEVDFDDVRLDGAPNGLGPCSGADLNADALINAADYAAFRLDLRNTDPGADLIGDPTVDAFDPAALMRASVAGCP
ncbi:MAG: hypothetical protein AAGI30_13195 [Planctomycetota bacterium]